MPLEQGQTLINRYRIASLLGQGGFGAVYRVWDLNLSRTCALKENLDTSDEARKQFEREAQILANLSHPGLPRVTDHFFVPGQGQYLVMDYIEGDDLQKMLERSNGPLPEGKVLEWILQVCDALAYLHSHTPSVIHRDIKPANIKITPQGQAMLVDFGIAKMLSPGLRTTTGARAVTPGYSPPEQYGQGQTDTQSDIYALGATLYHLLTGRVPPDSVDIVTGNVPAPAAAHDLNPRVSPNVSAAVQRAMHTSRTGRFRTMSEMRMALLTPVEAEPRTEKRGETPAEGSTQPALTPPPVARLAGAQAAVRPPRSPSQPTTAPRPAGDGGPTMLWLAGGGLVFLGLLVVGVWGIVWVLGWMNSAGTPTPNTRTQGSLQTTPAVNTQAAENKPTPTHTVTPVPVVTLSTGVPMPRARLAFVSNHRSDGKERIYIIDVTGGNYAPGDINDGKPFAQPTAVPADDRYDMAWWPDWCGGNQTMFFEIQDTRDQNYQTVAFVGMGQSSAPQQFQMQGVAKLGVPRCSTKGQKMLVSALKDLNSNNWELYEYDMVSQVTQRVGDGFSFAGYASWASDDTWVVFMHKGPQDNGFRLIQLAWSPFNFSNLKAPDTYTSQKYPAISPKNGDIAFACGDQQQWSLCLMNHNTGSVRVLLSNLGTLSGTRPAPQKPVPAVTPSWSPDGNWLAYASNKDGDWDVYLYSPDYGIEYNLTQALTGDQFEPTWSKP